MHTLAKYTCTQCRQAVQCAGRRRFLKHCVVPEAERANAGPEKLAEQRGKERAAPQGRIGRRVRRTGFFFFLFYLCMDLIFPS